MRINSQIGQMYQNIGAFRRGVSTYARDWFYLQANWKSTESILIRPLHTFQTAFVKFDTFALVVKGVIAHFVI